MQNPIQSFLQKFTSKHTFYPDTFPLLKSALPFQTYYKTLYREGFGCGHILVLVYFLTLITLIMEERDKVGYEQAGPLPRPST